MATTFTKEKSASTFETLKGKFGWTNPMQAPHLSKIIVSVGVGSLKDKKKLELIADRVAKITGQKAATRGAKQSISNFKTRQGDVVGYQVTLRGKRMNDFLDRLVNIALPRTRDFRGLSAKSIDAMGNYTLGVREHTIFPETADEDIRDVFGLAVTLVTTGNEKAQIRAFLEHLGMPLKKTETGPDLELAPGAADRTKKAPKKAKK
jgi:large subunit ribosomal protein L5